MMRNEKKHNALVKNTEKKLAGFEAVQLHLEQEKKNAEEAKREEEFNKLKTVLIENAMKNNAPEEAMMIMLKMNSVTRNEVAAISEEVVSSGRTKALKIVHGVLTVVSILDPTPISGVAAMATGFAVSSSEKGDSKKQIL
jgi:hypothetical protein